MDESFYYIAVFLLGLQILLNAAVVAIGVVALGRPASRRRYQGEDRMHAINQMAYCSVSLGIAIILAKLLYDETVGPFFVVIAVTSVELTHLALKYFYSKRVPSPEDIETKNRYLPNTTAQAFLEEAQLHSEKPNEPE